MRRVAASALLLLGSASCQHFSLERLPSAVERGESVTSGGVRWHDLFVGDGPAATAGDTLVCDYTTWLADGARVDSTLDRGVPLEFVLGAAPLEGLNQGLLGMRPGGRRRLHVPPALAYGSKGVEDMIPPDAALDFEVHVLEVRPKSP